MSLLFLMGILNKNSTSPHLCVKLSILSSLNLESFNEFCTPKVVGPTFSNEGQGLGFFCRAGSTNGDCGEGGEGGGGVGSGEFIVGVLTAVLVMFVISSRTMGEAGDLSSEVAMLLTLVTDASVCTDSCDCSVPGDNWLGADMDVATVATVAVEAGLSFLGLFLRLTFTGLNLILLEPEEADVDIGATNPWCSIVSLLPLYVSVDVG